MKTRRLIAATFLAALAATVAASPAEAGKHHNKHSKHHGHGYDSDRQAAYRPVAYRSVAYRPVVVPARIAVHGARIYDPYFDRGVWYGPHRHQHAVYSFPVLVRPGVVAYAPHTYCDGHLLVRGDVVLEPYDRYAVPVGYDGGHYRWDDRVSGYVSVGGSNFRVAVGF